MFGIPVFGWLIAAFVAAGLALLHYYQLLRENGVKSPWIWAMVCRFFAWTSLILLLFNPWWIHVKQWVQEPVLLVYSDASESVREAEKRAWNQRLMQLSHLKGVAIQSFHTADAVVLSSQSKGLDTFHTNLSAVIQHANNIATNTAVAGIVWMTDGIANEGVNPKFENAIAGVPWFTVGAGNPRPQIDASVEQLQCNDEAFLGNSFVVEASIKSQRMKAKTLRIQLTAGGKKYEQLWTPSSDQDWRRFSFDIRPTAKGLMPIEMQVLGGEVDQNQHNNRMAKYVKVVDERKKVAIVYGSPHPDVAALKAALESGGQFIVTTSPKTGGNTDADVYVFHGCKFPSARDLDQLKTLLSAGKAVWLFATESQNMLGLSKVVGLPEVGASPRNWQEVQPHWNDAQANWGVNDLENSRWLMYPPVFSPVYKPSMPASAEVLLYQRWSGVNTQIPLMMRWLNGDASLAMFYGEGIWRWRISEKSKNGDAGAFDAWVRRSVGMLAAAASTRKTIEILLAGTSFDVRDRIVARVVCRDRGGMLDHGLGRGLHVVGKDGRRRNIDLVKGNEGWSGNLAGLSAGQYQIVAQTADGKHKDERTMIVVDEPVETKHLQADHGLLKKLASQSNGIFFTLEKGDSIVSGIAQKMVAKPVMKAQSTNVHWWESWPWMISIALFFGIEWWIRRYLGKY